MKKTISLFLAVLLTLSCGTAALAADINVGEERVVIGADLSAEEVSSVYKDFGVERGNVTELTVTNAEERTYLEGVVDEATIGSRSISCVYIQVTEKDSGLNISTNRINWCTASIYQNALITAGIYDAKVIISAPFEVSGTAALTGIYKAYEDITGEKLSTAAKDAATNELIITSELADEIGDADATEIVNALKEILSETVNMTDEELLAEIRALEEEYDVSLTEAQENQLIDLVRMLEKLDTNQLMEKVKSVQESVKKLSQATGTVTNIVNGIKNFFAGISNFFSGLFGKKS